ncbi:UDP-N-acetylglucosamine 2-epimerase [Bacillus alkalicellulosilyticus]|uniref:UDP-N-acetylglucosamine 2-epimerase n=1 Tax=Alkalihalobacterium alkalicellulosilyticum TaxID=1912214 RepID=UPI000997D74F|nr:UDP-N-acetylglucosamine 2-epimerase [Bacillus alkalicellulosilyticus]
MDQRKVCVVTGTRADYGLLYCLLQEIKSSEEFQLQIVATGMHLSPEFGLTYRIIEEDGFHIDEKVETLLSSDTSIGIAKSIGLGVIGFAEAFGRLQPDVIVLLGDRFEIFAAAQAALVTKIPIAHIAGGDTTEGAYDEAFRHSITKMSHLHFVTNKQSEARVKQLGENPNYIYNFGNPGLDYIKQVKLLSKEELEESLNFRFKKKNILVTYHPVTLSSQSSQQQVTEVLASLDQLGDSVGIIFTMPNADNDGREIIKMINNFCETRPHTKAFTSLGQERYFSTVNMVDVVVGNSSSGIYEVPSYKKPTVNIGDRQKGRTRPNSVIDCKVNQEAISKSIEKAFRMDCTNIVNPFGEGDTSVKIVKSLGELQNFSTLIKKRFFEVKL